MVLPSVLVLVCANLLNNRYARRWCVPTSVVSTAVLVGLGRRSGCSWEELGFSRRRAPRGAAVGGVLFGAVAVTYAIGAATPATRGFFRDERAGRLSSDELLVQMFLEVPLGTVLLEEVAFRGVLPGMLRRSHGVVVSSGIPAVLFGLWHVLPTQELMIANPVLAASVAGEDPRRMNRLRVTGGAVVCTGAAGVLFSELRRRSGSLLAPVGLHLGTNMLGYLAAWLVSSRRTFWRSL